MFSRLLRIGAVVAVLMPVLVPGVGAQAPQTAMPAGSTAVRVNTDGTVSVKADGVAVQALLEALEPVCPIQVRLDAKAAVSAVSLDVSDLDPADAVGAVLRSSGLDFAMHTRCGTPTQPALVVVRLAGDGPIVSLAPRVDSDDPRVKQAIADALPLPVPGPPPEPEKREDPGTPGGGTVLAEPDDRRELAPGEVTGTQLVELLAVRPGQKAAAAASPVIELPFTDANGQPVLQVRPPKSPTVILPFPDANGNLVEVPIPAGPRRQKADFPVYQPDAAGKSGAQPAAPPAGSANPADARRPGGGGADR